MVGGYCLNDRPPLRYNDWTPGTSETRSSTSSLDLSARATTTWNGRASGSGTTAIVARLQVYLVRIVEALHSGRTYILGGAYNSRVASFQMSALPRLLYQGPNAKRCRCCVHMDTRWSMLLRLYTGVLTGSASVYLRRRSRRSRRLLMKLGERLGECCHERNS